MPLIPIYILAIPSVNIDITVIIAIRVFEHLTDYELNRLLSSSAT